MVKSPPHEMIPTADILQRANAIIQQIEALQTELVGLFGGTATPAPKRRGRPPGSAMDTETTNGAPGKRRRMSAEGRARIAAGAKARWEKYRADQGLKTDNNSAAPAPAPSKAAHKVGGMTAEGRAAIAAGQKARWAKVRAEKKKAARI